MDSSLTVRRKKIQLFYFSRPVSGRFSAKAIPGGALTCYTVMFTQLGIPGEALALAVAINSMIDFIATASNLTCLQVEVTTVAGQLGMLDTECLKNPG